MIDNVVLIVRDGYIVEKKKINNKIFHERVLKWLEF